MPHIPPMPLQDHRIEQAIRALEQQHYLTITEVYKHTLEWAVQLTDSEIGYFHLYHEANHNIELNVWSEKVLTMCKTVYDSHYPLQSAGIWADCIRQRRPVIHNDYGREASDQGLPQGHFPLFRHLSLPIIRRGHIKAVLGVGNRAQPYEGSHAQLLLVFTDRCWPIIQDKIRQVTAHSETEGDRFYRSTPETVLMEMVEAFSRALEIRDRYTAMHQENVAAIADGIAMEMGLSDNKRLGLRLGALLHDIGKIGIPSEILIKPGQLNAAEYELIKTHATIGAQIFQTTTLPWPIRDMILQHHERSDGSGYPQGLHENMIILEARIIAVADVFEAMASHRPYRPAIGMEAAIAHIQQKRGHLYDPYVVDAFLRYIDRHGEEW